MKNNQLITRREAIIAGVASLGALILPGCTKPMPPTYGSILRMGDALTYLSHKALLPGQALAPEFRHSEISSYPATWNTTPEKKGQPYFDERFDRLQYNAFADYGLSVEGCVDHPGSFSISDLQKLPSQTQITRHTCEEGWSAIAEWTGVPLRHVLQTVGIQAQARYLYLFAYDGFFESIDLLDGFHPQTILAYGMNGRAIPVQHGAPLRLRVETQLGYKSVKALERIVVADKFPDTGNTGWSWYAGI